MAVHDFGLEGVGSVWKFFPGMKRLRVVVDHHWMASLQRRHPAERLVEGLLGKAREDVPELRDLEWVHVRVVCREEMRVGRGDGEVELGASSCGKSGARDLSW